MKKRKFDITRPDKLLFSGVKSLINLDLGLYSDKKNLAKEKGEITFIGEKKVDQVESQLLHYNKENLEKSNGVAAFNFLNEANSGHTYWLNFHGLHDTSLVQQLGRTIQLDRLTTIQILDTTLRPKVEEHDQYLFFSVKSILKDEGGSVIIEQMSFILGENYVISFQEEDGDHFDHIRIKIEEDLGLLRKKGADYLLYQLLDAVLDNYFEIIENINQEIRGLEKEVLRNPQQEDLINLEKIKQFAETIKKSLTPFKESLRVITNRQSKLILEDNRKYYNDLLSNCLGVIEEVDATIKSVEGLTNIYFSSLSQKMNETMKVLTTVATIFIPLTFIAGIYGMNFDNMPELHHKNGYFYVCGVMGVVFVAMIIYFRRKKWL